MNALRCYYLHLLFILHCFFFFLHPFWICVLPFGIFSSQYMHLSFPIAVPFVSASKEVGLSATPEFSIKLSGLCCCICSQYGTIRIFFFFIIHWESPLHWCTGRICPELCYVPLAFDHDLGQDLAEMENASAVPDTAAKSRKKCGHGEISWWIHQPW